MSDSRDRPQTPRSTASAAVPVRKPGRGPGAAPPRLDWVSRSVDATERAGAELAKTLCAGDVIALSGPLGAGKSRLVDGIARGLGCSGAVRSPTFTLVNEYTGRLKLFHADLYRVDSADVETLGLAECIELGVLAVEWGEKLPPTLQREALRLEIALLPGNRRRFSVAAGARGRGAVLSEAWRAGVGAPSSSHVDRS